MKKLKWKNIDVEVGDELAWQMENVLAKKKEKEKKADANQY